MKNTKLCILLLILNYTLFAEHTIPDNEYKQDFINQDASFIYNDDEYKIEIIGELWHNDYNYDNELHIIYRVFKNDKEIKSEGKMNYIYSNCDYVNGGPFENYYDITSIAIEDNQIGWTIYSGGICGNQFQYNSEIILVPLDSNKPLIKSNQLTKVRQIIYHDNNDVNIYYFPQKWNYGGTVASQMVPRKLTYNIINHTLENTHLNFTKDIPYINSNNILWNDFISIFMGGFYDFNLDLMMYAIDNHYKVEEMNIYEEFFGANWPLKEELMNFSNEEEKKKFMDMMSEYHYGGHRPPWMEEELGIVVNENIIIKKESIQLFDCSVDTFQEVIIALSR